MQNVLVNLHILFMFSTWSPRASKRNMKGECAFFVPCFAATI